MSILLSLQAVGSQAADQMPDLTAVTLPTEAEINVIDLAFKGAPTLFQNTHQHLLQLFPSIFLRHEAQNLPADC